MSRVVCTLCRGCDTLVAGDESLCNKCRNKPGICKHGQNKAGCFSCRDVYIAKLEAMLKKQMAYCTRADHTNIEQCKACCEILQLLKEGV